MRNFSLLAGTPYEVCLKFEKFTLSHSLTAQIDKQRYGYLSFRWPRFLCLLGNGYPFRQYKEVSVFLTIKNNTKWTCFNRFFSPKSNDGPSLSSSLSNIFNVRHDTTIFSPDRTPHLYSWWIEWIFPRPWSLLLAYVPRQCLRYLCLWRDYEDPWRWKGT